MNFFINDNTLLLYERHNVVETKRTIGVGTEVVVTTTNSKVTESQRTSH